MKAPISANSEPDWRTRHCAEDAAEAVLKATGSDPWDALGGCPRSPREAAAIYRRLGVTNLKDAVSAVLGEPIGTPFAMRGDVVMAQNALGTCRGDLAEFMDRMLPMGAVECAWRVK